MDCPPGQKNVAVVERWPLVEVRLYWGSKTSKRTWGAYDYNN